MTLNNNPQDVVTDEEPELNAKQMLLQKNIRVFATIFLQELILGVPDLPSESEYLKLQQGYKQRLREKIEMERQQASALATSSAPQQFKVSWEI